MSGIDNFYNHKPAPKRNPLPTPEAMLLACGTIQHAINHFREVTEKVIEDRNAKRAYVPTDVDQAAHAVINALGDFAVEFERMKMARAAANLMERSK